MGRLTGRGPRSRHRIRARAGGQGDGPVQLLPLPDQLFQRGISHGRADLDQKGNLYGTTGGGGDGYGTAFKLTAAGKETVLYNFCGQDNCADGKQPFGGLVFDQKGNLYGTTYIGGLTVCTNGCGVVFKLTPNFDTR